MIGNIITIATNLADSIYSALGLIVNPVLLILAILGARFLVFLIGFIFKGVGLYTIAKRENISKAYFAFIPFLSIYLIGKIVGNIKVFGYSVKNLGLLTMIAMIVYYLVALTYDFLLCKEVLVIFLTGGTVTEIPTSLGLTYVDVLFNGLSLIFNLIYIVLYVFLVIAFFRYYSPTYAVGFSLISIIFDFMFGILVFVVRKNERVDYSQYMKMRFDRYNGQGSQGGFNNPDSPFTQYNHNDKKPFEDYDNGNQQNNTKNQVDDVFEDYSSQNDNTDGDLF